MTSHRGPAIRKDTAAKLISASRRKVIDMCAKGEIKVAKLGTDWRINTAAFLGQFGI